MILSDKQILEAKERGDIIITPFDLKSLGSNSYDVRLSDNIAWYYQEILDCKKENELRHFKIPKDGMILDPGTLYLSSTVEYTETRNLVPCLEGKSSLGRLGLFVHITAGFGDINFCGHWTLELSVVQPIKIYPGMPIGQLVYFFTGECLNPYDSKKDSKYNKQGNLPVGSQMYKNFIK